MTCRISTCWREKTLLMEFEQSAKSSVFQDRRIGERDETLPEFDKAILRQQREHMPLDQRAHEAILKVLDFQIEVSTLRQNRGGEMVIKKKEIKR
ncbi:hypothetical protein GUJ93_ZPchr0006g44998 [Zizania palustris]|uniref:Uncharacterized protein n=1 Tax=Zizania palustris TaxID=103762 RepID=A0A8J5VHG5_ZIZPA|nr:hypothetical protein GUJ93_ZPchr0006g44998 [Zizania palustris]